MDKISEIEEPITPANIEDVAYDPAQINAEAFAKWLSDAYRRSSFKRIRDLARAVDSNPATISRLMNAAPQTLTNKPSKPKLQLVKKLAEALEADEGEGLFYAGHIIYGRPNKKPQNFAELVAALESLGIDMPIGEWDIEDAENYTEDDFEELKQRIAMDTDITIRRKKK